MSNMNFKPIPPIELRTDEFCWIWETLNAALAARNQEPLLYGEACVYYQVYRVCRLRAEPGGEG